MSDGGKGSAPRPFGDREQFERNFDRIFNKQPEMAEPLAKKLMRPSGVLEVGRFSYGNPNIVVFPSSQKLIIGSFCSIADGVTFLLGGNHNTKAVTTYPLNALFMSDDLPWHESGKGQTIVGNDVWIGHGATILSGVRIGDGAVIAAGAVVTKEVQPYSIVAGNPAVVVSTRFDQNTIEHLLQLRWWDWPIEHIRRKAKFLMSNFEGEEQC